MAAPTGVLAQIVAHKREEVAARKAAVGLDVLARGLPDAPPGRPFSAALRAGHVAVIAEIKRASPSQGVFAPHLDAAEQARLYAAGGAAAISVLTDERFFQGSLDDLRAAAGAVGLPLLRKDFILDRYQLVEARLAGASLALLIVAMLSPAALRTLIAEARDLGLEPLVEVHAEPELAVALEAGADLVGINNRDLTTFVVDLATTERLRVLIPPGIRVVGESGIHTGADVRRLSACGVDAILVGESLVRAGAGGLELLRDLVAAGRPAPSSSGPVGPRRKPPAGGTGRGPAAALEHR
jgi:indole-3-glycerol phosphate synthase